MISATVIGHLGADPELKWTQDGKPILELRVASNSSKKDAEPTWVRASIWGDRAEKAAPYWRKGDRVCLSGTMQLRSYDAKSGEKKYSLEMRVDAFEFAHERRDDDTKPRTAPAMRSPSAAQLPPKAVIAGPASDDDIPF